MNLSPCWRAMHYVAFILFNILAIGTACLSLAIQTQPLHFVPGVKVTPSELPLEWMILGGALILLSLIISCIRIRLSSCCFDVKPIPIPYEWCSTRPDHRLFILSRLNVLRPIQFISEFIRVCKANGGIYFHSSPIICILSWILAVITVVALGIGLHVVFRAIISGSIFIVAYSLYFTNVITISIPFVYYFYLLHHYYQKRHSDLSFHIVKGLKEVDKRINKIFDSTKGEIDIYFRTMNNRRIGKEKITIKGDVSCLNG